MNDDERAYIWKDFQKPRDQRLGRILAIGAIIVFCVWLAAAILGGRPL